MSTAQGQWCERRDGDIGIRTEFRPFADPRSCQALHLNSLPLADANSTYKRQA